MDEKQIELEVLLDELRSGVTLVTVNQRLARHLGLAYDARQLDRALDVWETPDILPWNAWLQRCWETAVSMRAQPGVSVLLNPHQEQVLWERAVATEDGLLLQEPAAARSAREAWGLLHAWQLDLGSTRDSLGEDVRAFERWAAQYDQWCLENGWLDSARLPAAVCDRLADENTGLPDRLLVMGFDELTPAQKAVLTRLEAEDCQVTLVAPVPLQGSEPFRVPLSDVEEELRAAACWVRSLLERVPDADIGVVVPDLAACRVQLARVFDDVLIPGVALPGDDTLRRPYNLSLGQPLADRPLVQTALAALELAYTPIATERLGVLLRSPFLVGGEAEMNRRGLLDARVRQLKEPRVSLEALRRQAAVGPGDRPRSFACPELAVCLGRIGDEAEIYRQRRSASGWAEVFSGILHHFGWPGERPLDSTEFQTVQAWRELLIGLSSLDAVSSPLGFEQALSRLGRLAQSTPFQPRSFDVPVQVLGVLEAAGIQFDYLWVMGLHDEAWPRSPHPNPFLPVGLQRDQNLPHASAERELEFAATVIRRLRDNARQVVFSHPVRDGERALRPSPLITAFREEPIESLDLPARVHYAAALQESGALEHLEQDPGPPLSSLDPVSGGTAILQDQAACPFRAFARHRLGARALESVSVGLDPVARGSLVHAALEEVWAALGSHAALGALSAQALGQIVVAAVRKAVRESARRRPLTFSERFTLLEEERLVRLITRWLEAEKGRSPFVVESREQGRKVQVGGLSLVTRPDRVDRLLDGGLVVLDYKTGKASRRKWFGERPDEPQLPIYAITSDDPVDAVFFAKLRPDDVGFEGVARMNDVVPGVPAFADSPDASEFGSWKGLVSAWRAELERLAEAFLAGHATVSPKKYPQTCEYCELGAFCRIRECVALSEGSLDDAGP